ncbi:hypothetical protein LOC59_00015 [Arthrobacter sp. zg-Y916]|uniref:DUF6916 family protein n=1 Tax=Arthrobacter sp. zg-Y916 TaxID=2894190 RepID=UPI001E2930DE|nr:hypothetical protein [Arthrobacter sp. zg-Y916]MCC9192038.1 hypothetical protein [Arthrobacter sp. zg-Y916]
MPAAKALNRRLFLAGTTGLAMAAAATAANGTLPRAGAAQAPDPYSLELWEPLLGRALAIGAGSIRLTAVDRGPLGFRLLFEVGGAIPADDIYTVQHPDSGPVALFMTAHGEHAAAIITHLPKETSYD